MRPHFIAFVFLTLAAPSVARADGCKFASDGRKVPEREQRALIEWADGIETLHVAALSDPATEGSVWVVPVRAGAGLVRAEPVDEYPVVTYYETLRWRAVQTVVNWISVAGILDSGGLCCPVFVGGCGGDSPKAIEASRVEALGMIVTVVSANSRAEIEAYLEAQGVSRTADLSSLEPYFGQSEYSFVCGWVGNRGEPVTATGLKVVFPSPTIWFPLRPTRAYTNPVETVVYVRGFVKPASGCNLPGLRCEYVFADVQARGVAQAFTKDWERDLHHYHHSRPLEQFTRVTLTTDPQQWDRDLELVPGTTLAGTVALVVTGQAGTYLAWSCSALIGGALGLVIPLLTIPKAERRRVDWFAGALTGAAIVLSLWASALVLASWRWRRFPDRPNAARRYLVLPALGIAHFTIVAAVCQGLIAWIEAGG